MCIQKFNRLLYLSLHAEIAALFKSVIVITKTSLESSDC